MSATTGLTMTFRSAISTMGIGALLAAAVAACGSKGAAAGSNAGSAGKTADSANGAVGSATARAGGGLPDTAHGTLPPNHMGRIPVLEYHVIGDKNALYTRTAASYKADLEEVYRRGYRPITIAQLLDKDFSEVPAGMS